MSVRCIALFSGGLDSMLAVRIIQQQGVEVEAVNFKTVFTCCQDQAGQAARKLGIRLTVLGQGDDYFELLKHPRFGYGRGANPCVDCRIYMLKKAELRMRQTGARFLITGEILGQRPMSQKREDLAVIAHHSGFSDRLLRPLCARLLPPTLPEREGWVDRQRFYDFHGRSRRGLISLARQFGLPTIPTPSNGCALTEPRFSQKVFDLMDNGSPVTRWDWEMLKHGRHFRFDQVTKVIVGRSEEENGLLEYMHQLPQAHSTVLLQPENFNGPAALLIGSPSQAALNFAGGLLLRYSKLAAVEPVVEVTGRIQTTFTPRMTDHARQAVTLATL